MDADRLAVLLSDLDADRLHGADVGGRLCDACVEVLGVSGAGIVLITGGEHQSTFGGSDSVIGVIEELQFTLGEGPCIDAYRSGRPVFEPDLGQPAVARWQGFSGPAIDAGVRAVFGFPLLAGTGTIGALDVYVDRPGVLEPDQIADAVTFAEVISNTVLAMQADVAPGALAPQFDASVRYRAVVHQASGMLSSQLRIDVSDALARIRAHAYAVNLPVNDIAREIVHRRLVLE